MYRSALIVVAHPDDETLWAGGTILMNAQTEWTIIVMCRASDPDRAPRFARVLEELKASGVMADMDDGPAQHPLRRAALGRTILSLLGEKRNFDLIVTHSPYGEYTRHRRHEETGRAVVSLWRAGRLQAPRLWLFAYEDNFGAHLPRAIAEAHRSVRLSGELWKHKHRIITELYGFPLGGFEEQMTPKTEAFWCFRKAEEVVRWMDTMESKKRGRNDP